MKNINTTTIEEIIKEAYRSSLGSGLREVTYYDLETGEVSTLQDVNGGNSMPIGVLDGSVEIICEFSGVDMSEVRSWDDNYQRCLLIRAGLMANNMPGNGGDIVDAIADGSFDKLLEMYPEIVAEMDRELIDYMVDEFDVDAYIEHIEQHNNES